MKKIFLFVLMFLSTLFSAQKIVGNWEGNLKTPSFELPIIIHILKGENGYQSTFDSPKQGAKDIPFNKTNFNDGKLHLEHSSLHISYDGILKNDEIIGTFQQNGMRFPMNLKPLKKEFNFHRPQTPKPPFDYHSQEVSFKNKTEGNLLAGTLVTPKNTTNKDFPIVVMITGSGKQDRNETLFQHQPFWVIADYLAQKGIGSLRLDDRGVGKSEKGKDGATSTDFAGDIASAVDFLNQQKFTNIGLLGHSEGGMIAPMVALQNKNVKFQILLAAPGIPIKELMLIQNEKMASLNGVPPSTIAENKLINTQIYDFVLHYQGENLKSDLKDFIATTMKDKLSENQLTQFAENQSESISNPWFRYFIQFNPDDYLSKTEIPTLALNGKLDVQVTAKENLEGIEKSLQKARSKKLKIIAFDKLNHLFQTAKTGSPTEYAEIEETIAPKVLETITQWIHSL